jgi:hydroxyethylthiazole kinase
VIGPVSAHVHFSAAAELAEAVASRAGSFVAAFIDALDAVGEISLLSTAKIHPAVLIHNLEPTTDIELHGAVL